MYGHRRQLTRLLSDPAVTVIVVEHRDRLTGLGCEYLAVSLAVCGRRSVVREDSETTSDLLSEVTEVVTGLCARRYGQRCAARRTATAVAVVTGGQL
jgi:putative resolvase